MPPPLADDEIEVIPFLLDSEEVISLEQAEGWLSAGELERADAFRFPILRERFIRGRGMVRKVLAEHLGCGPQDFRFETGERGKPYLPGGEMHFNLTHSEERAALAVSRIPSIGIDIEKFERKVDIDGLSHRCFRESEYARIEELEGEDKVRAFFWTWTAKEARMKATGEGFGLEPKKIEISFQGEHPEICIEPQTPKAWLSAVVLPDDEVACTVAAISPFKLKVNG